MQCRLLHFFLAFKILHTWRFSGNGSMFREKCIELSGGQACLEGTMEILTSRWQTAANNNPTGVRKSLEVQLPCSKRHWKIPRAVKGLKNVSRFTLGVREVEYKSGDSEASWLIYITIWQPLRREGSSKRTDSWPTGKEISIKDLEGIILLSSPWFWVIVS